MPVTLGWLEGRVGELTYITDGARLFEVVRAAGGSGVYLRDTAEALDGQALFFSRRDVERMVHVKSA